jgi:hypothetical protein
LVVFCRIPLAEFLATAAHHRGGTLHSHSITSHRRNPLFWLLLSTSLRVNTVRDPVEKFRWRTIDPDRSRKTPKHVLSDSFLPHRNAFRPRPVLPSSAKNFTVERTAETDRCSAIDHERCRSKCCSYSSLFRIRTCAGPNGFTVNQQHRHLAATTPLACWEAND